MLKIYNCIYKKKKNLCLLTLLIYCLIAFLHYNAACKNPHNYEPFDSLYPPPAPPILIFPPNDTIIVYYEPFPHDIIFEWNSVEDAESYQLQVVNDTTQLVNAPVIKITDTSTIYTLPRKDHYYWRVRAYSPKWEWFTNWSETRHFYAYYEEAK